MKSIKKIRHVENSEGGDKQREGVVGQPSVGSPSGQDSSTAAAAAGLKYYWNQMYDWLYQKNFRILCSLLQNGPIPRHIGIIMDGNRRYARMKGMETSEGHRQGFSTMIDMCQWALMLGVHMISVYAFSIENFKRPKNEVDYLMELANEKFTEMIDKSHKLHKFGVRINVVGDYTPIPEKTKSILARAVKATAGNTGAVLNICMSYTSHEEILHSMRTLSTAVMRDSLIWVDDINLGLFQNAMYIKEDLDILIRTSGEYRLSDFMLWQSSFCNSNFLKVLWPDFSFLHFCYIVFLYQSNYLTIKNQILKNTDQQDTTATEDSKKRVDSFLNFLRNTKDKDLNEMENCYNPTDTQS